VIPSRVTVIGRLPACAVPDVAVLAQDFRGAIR
jgi:hypothetical protein